MNRRLQTILAGALSLQTFVAGASARTLTVGPDGQYTRPSQAAAVAQSGDTIRIAPGTYTDCMRIDVSNVSIVGTGPGVVLQNVVCADKGIIVIEPGSSNTIVDNLVLQGATSTDRNGAGIRGQGENLIVRGTTFRNNQMGILATDPIPTSTIVVSNSVFEGNGNCSSFCGHAIYAGRIGKLDVEDSNFSNEIFGHYIKSRALLSVIVNNSISDTPTSHSSYLIDIPNGGAVQIVGNTLEKGVQAENHCCAIQIGEEGVRNPTSFITIRDNSLVNNSPDNAIFVTNNTATRAALDGNKLIGNLTPLIGPE
jgi:hypothetical protein